MGSAVSVLHERSCADDVSSRVEPVVERLAGRSMRHAYFGLLYDGAVTVSQVKTPPGSPPVGIVRGFHGASHALALGKVLIGGCGPEGAREYAENFGMEVFTPRTVVRPDLFEAHLDRVRVRGFATDVEEFAENLCCVAAPVLNGRGMVEGAVGVSTSAARFAGEARSLIELVRTAAKEASDLLPEEGPARRPRKDG